MLKHQRYRPWQLQLNGGWLVADLCSSVGERSGSREAAVSRDRRGEVRVGDKERTFSAKETFLVFRTRNEVGQSRLPGQASRTRGQVQVQRWHVMYDPSINGVDRRTPGNWGRGLLGSLEGRLGPRGASEQFWPGLSAASHLRFAAVMPTQR